MKNKKKNEEITSKFDIKSKIKQPVFSNKKSPIKNKNISLEKSPFVSSLAPYQQNNNQIKHVFVSRKNKSEDNHKLFGDSNQSSTYCSINNKSKKEKGLQNKKSNLKTKNTSIPRYKQISENSQDFSQFNQNKIMNLINNYAIKIQRQWRKYWFRKCLKFIILKERQNKKIQQLTQQYHFCQDEHIFDIKNKSNNNWKESEQNFRSNNLQKQQNRVHFDLSKLNSGNRIKKQKKQQSQNEHELTQKGENLLTYQNYNNQKYASISSLGSKNVLSNNLLKNSNNNFSHHQKPSSLFSHQRTSSLGERLQQLIQKTPQQKLRKDLSQKQKKDIGLNCSLTYNNQSRGQQTYLTPINGLKYSSEKSCDPLSSYKKGSIKFASQVYQCKIATQYHEIVPQSNKSPIKQKSIESNPKIKKGNIQQGLTQGYRNEKSIQKIKQKKYEERYPKQVESIISQCKRAIQIKKNKNRYSLQKKFQQKQLTERTYKKLLKETDQKVIEEINVLQLKEKMFKSNLNDIYFMFKEYANENSDFLGDDLSHIQHENLDASSMSFDKWDFESSAKKSISNLESFEEFTKQLNEKNNKNINKSNYLGNRIDHQPIELVLAELDKLEEGHALSQSQKFSNYQTLQGKQLKKQRVNSFQKKSFDAPISVCSNEYLNEIPSENILQKTPRQDILEEKIKKIDFSSPINFSKNLKQIYSQLQKDQQFVNTVNIQTKNEKLLESNKIEKKDNQEQKGQLSDQFSQVQLKMIGFPRKQAKIDNKNSQILLQDISIDNDIQQQLKRQKANKQKLLSSYSYFSGIFQKHFQTHKFVVQKKIISQTISILTHISIQKQKRKQLQLRQLKKYPRTIDASIDAINNWLLEVCHFMLDHHNLQIKNNLVSPKQLSPTEMIAICKDPIKSCGFFQDHHYQTISQRVFKQFQFFYIKTIARNLSIQTEKYETFSSLLYAFHRCLIDCMNLTLLQELSVGKNWVILPWAGGFRYRKRETQEHAKQCLERAINRVSNWAQYCMSQLQRNSSQVDWKQYQQQKMSLIIKQQVLQYPVQNSLYMSNIIFSIYKQIEQQQIIKAVQQLRIIF